jgi:hypothetical protein
MAGRIVLFSEELDQSEKQRTKQNPGDRSPGFSNTNVTA